MIRHVLVEKLSKTYNNSTTIRHLHAQQSFPTNLHRLPSRNILQKHRPAIIQLIVETIPIKRGTRNRIATISHKPLQSRQLTSTVLRNAESELLHAAYRRRIRVVVTDRGVMVMQVDQHNLRQLAVNVTSVSGFERILQIDVDNLRTMGGAGQVSEKRCDGDVTVVRGFCANGRAVRADGLPGLVSVVCALVHVEAGDVLRSHEEVCVHTLRALVSIDYRSMRMFVGQLLFLPRVQRQKCSKDPGRLVQKESCLLRE